MSTEILIDKRNVLTRCFLQLLLNRENFAISLQHISSQHMQMLY